MSIDFNILNTTPTTGADSTDMVNQLAKRADTNGDGSVSTTEFSNFLSELLESIAGGLPGAGPDEVPGVPGPGPAAPEPPAEPGPAVTSADAGVALAGWDAAKWANAEHTTPKYVVGRILANFPPTPQGLEDALAAIQEAIPGTTLAKNDTLDIPGVGKVDVGLSFSTGGNVGWWWGPLDVE